jgi:catechol 2,3-dioxygenase
MRGMGRRIDPRVDIGHVHLAVAELDRAVAFYTEALGFEVTQRTGDSAAFLSAGGYHHHLGLFTGPGSDGHVPSPQAAGLVHFAIRYPDRAALGAAVRRLREQGTPIERAADHGVSESVYLRDPDGNGVALCWDRPRAEWPKAADGTLAMMTGSLDVDALVRAADQSEGGPQPAAAPMGEGRRQQLRDFRARLLHLHKVLLEDARAAYEMDRGRVGSNANLLQLVISDPWFAWLHALSELIIRIDQAVESDSPASEDDAAALVEQTGALLTASESGDGFAGRYYEALQRQPAVVLAHADVRRLLKDLR